MSADCLFCNGPVDRFAVAARYCWPCGKASSRVMWEAYLALRKAIRKGVVPPIKSQFCVDCGAFAQVYDHRDYFKPLDVQPVCGHCNQRRGSAPMLIGQVQHFVVSKK